MRRSWALVMMLLSDAAADPKPPKPALQCPSRMVAIAGGTYEMGNGTSKHKVTVEPFCIDRTEVTVAAYSQCAAMNVCAPAPEAGPSGWEALCNGKRSDRQAHPVNCVDWSEAVAYCTWAGARLPSEEEWEFAARGKDGRQYPWGNAKPSPTLMNACGTECAANMKQVANANLDALFGDDGFVGTAPVGSFPAGASPAGVLDMAGNVSEWTASGTADSKVTRGASWSHSHEDVFFAHYPITNTATSRISYLGFRCVR